VKPRKVGFKLNKTSVTAVVGTPVYYDGGQKYDDGKYYNRWYTASGTLTQPEMPKVTIKEGRSIIKPHEKGPRIRIK
jgi:hypothetical protein